jgi:cell division transport system permease protein
MNGRSLIAFERIIKSGVVNFGRNIWLAVASMAMMAITLTILLFAIVANATFTNSVNDITDKIDIKFFLKDNVSDQQRKDLISNVKGLSNVESVVYISKEAALKQYQQENANNSNLLTAISLTDNPLPASLTIKPRDPNRIDEIRAFLDKPQNKALQSENTDYSADRKTAIDKIIKATHFFEEAGVVGIIVFMVISILIIFNTIRMTIFNRRDELVIMRLLGASTSYIRGPFIVETMLYGVVAALVSIAICGSLFKIASSTLRASTFGLLDITYSNSYFSDRFGEILLLQIAIGIIIGAASSAFATRRYLKVNR